MDMPTISIGGSEYPMNFSLRAAQAMSERYGGMEHIMEALSGDDLGKVLGELAWMIALLVGQGVARRNILEGTHEAAPSEEEVGVLMGVSDLAGLKGSVFTAMAAGMERAVETEPEEKNAVTTRRKASSRGASTTG